MKKGKVLAVNTSENVGEKKTDVGKGMLLAGYGLKGDAHAGTGRQVSLLAKESIDRMREKGLQARFGDFAENITTEGLELTALPIGSCLRIGHALLEITQIGKVCRDRCNIYFQMGDCVMPKEGVFAKVLEEGTVKVGDDIEVL